MIHEFILEDTLDAPLFPALFTLNMLQGTDQGQSSSEGQLREMLDEVGVGEVRRHPFVGPTESGIMMGILEG